VPAEPTQAAASLPDAYRRWRTSRPGQITDRVEEQLILELVGLREQAGASLTLVAVMVRSSQRWRALGALVTGIDRDNLLPALCGSCSSVSAMRCLARPAHGHWCGLNRHCWTKAAASENLSIWHV